MTPVAPPKLPPVDYLQVARDTAFLALHCPQALRLAGRPLLVAPPSLRLIDGGRT